MNLVERGASGSEGRSDLMNEDYPRSAFTRERGARMRAWAADIVANDESPDLKPRGTGFRDSGVVSASSIVLYWQSTTDQKYSLAGVDPVFNGDPYL